MGTDVSTKDANVENFGRDTGSLGTCRKSRISYSFDAEAMPSHGFTSL